MQNDRVKQERESKIGKIEVVRYTASFSHCEFDQQVISHASANSNRQTRKMLATSSKAVVCKALMVNRNFIPW